MDVAAKRFRETIITGRSYLAKGMALKETDASGCPGDDHYRSRTGKTHTFTTP